MSIVGFGLDATSKKNMKEINRLKPKTEEAIRKSWFKLGVDLKNEANRAALHKPKHGRTYIIRLRSGRTRRHVASAPGESHANLSGALRKSISWKVHGTERMDFGYGFSTTAANRAPFYDTFIEDGTAKIAPRPTIENAIKAVQNNTPDHFHKAMLTEFKRL